MRTISSLNDIADVFDAVLLDQFGVLHDGRKAFPGAVESVAALRKQNVPIVVLTNSGKRAADNAARLDRLGFPRHLFHAVVSSGELARAHISQMLASGKLKPGDPVAVISRDDDAGMIENHDLRRVRSPNPAKLLIIAGAEPETTSREKYQIIMKPLADAGVPALCINPDLHIYARGAPDFGPGQLARDYENLGGTVAMLGKPGREMFKAGLEALGGPEPARTLMIGDSPEHDVAGAQAIGCRTLLVAEGVQASSEGPQADFQMLRLA